MAFALNYLSAAELLAATASWVATDMTPAPGEPIRAAALLREHAPQASNALVSARLGLQGALAAREEEPALPDGTPIDARHDQLGRGIAYGLRAAEELTEDEHRREQLKSVRAALFPTGLRILRASWLEEAGQAQARVANLTADQRTFLGTLSIEGATMLAHVEEMGRLGEALGNLVASNASAEAAAAAARAPKGRMVSAKSKLIRAIRTVIDTLVLNDVDAAAVERFVGPLRQQAEDAERRALGRAARPAPTPPAS